MQGIALHPEFTRLRPPCNTQRLRLLLLLLLLPGCSAVAVRSDH
jgi:hypothetical protein